MNKSSDYQRELMLSDIRDNSLTGMIKNKRKERLTIITVFFIIADLIFMLYIYPWITSAFKITNPIAKTLLFIIISGIAYYFVIDEIGYQRKKKEKRKVEMISKGGDMVNYFMKIKDFVRKDYSIPHKITVIEGLSYQIVPVEVTYYRYKDYESLIDAIGNNNLTFQEFELKGRISLFDKYRGMYPKFEGTTLIKFLESIFRKNEEVYKNSTSRRLYIFLYISYSSDLENQLMNFIAGSHCNLQFLNERMYKELVEHYFCCPVNLERLKSKNAVRKISLDETKLIERFDNEEDLIEFLKNYKTVKYKNTFKYELRRGGK